MAIWVGFFQEGFPGVNSECFLVLSSYLIPQHCWLALVENWIISARVSFQLSSNHIKIKFVKRKQAEASWCVAILPEQGRWRAILDNPQEQQINEYLQGDIA